MPAEIYQEYFSGAQEQFWPAALPDGTNDCSWYQTLDLNPQPPALTVHTSTKSVTATPYISLSC